MNKIEQKNYHRMRRSNRIRAKVSGTASIPRLAVFRSARFITAQLIDDPKGVTLVEASDLKLTKGTKLELQREWAQQSQQKQKTKKSLRLFLIAEVSFMPDA